MALTKEERIELLKKAREAKKLKATSKKTTAHSSKTLELDLSNEINKDKEKEEREELVRNEVIKATLPKKKRIVKRVIEVEEPSTDEEVQEEVIIKPRVKAPNLQFSQSKSKAQSIAEIPKDDRASLDSSSNRKSIVKVAYYSDIFPA